MRLRVRLTSEPTCFIGVPPGLDYGAVEQGSTTFCMQWMHEGAMRNVYVGSVGKAAHEGCVDVPALFAHTLGLVEGDTVMVQPVPVPAPSMRLVMEPVSSNDWEILERNANAVELNLLRQIDTLTAYVPFPLRIQGNIHCSLVFTPQDPSQHYARVSLNSEIYVAPKPRSQAQTQRHTLHYFKTTPVATTSLSCAFLNPSDATKVDSTFISLTAPKHQHYSVLQQNTFSAPGPASLVLRVEIHDSVPTGRIGVGDAVRQVLHVPYACTIQVESVAVSQPNTMPASINLIPLKFDTVDDLNYEMVEDTNVTSDSVAAQEIVDMNGFDTQHDSEIKLYLCDGCPLLVHGRLFTASFSWHKRQPRTPLWIDGTCDLDAIPLTTSSERTVQPYLNDPVHVPPSLLIRSAIHDVAQRLLTMLEKRRSCHALAPVCGETLLTGSSGSGKSTAAKQLALELRTKHAVYPIWVPCRALLREKKTTVVSALQRIQQEAASHQPCLIVLDDLDILLPTPSDTDPQHDLRVKCIAERIYDMMCILKRLQVVLVATCASRSSLLAGIRESGMFDHDVHLSPLTLEEKQTTIRILAEQRGFSIDMDSTLLKEKTEGAVVSDLVQLVDKATHASPFVPHIHEDVFSRVLKSFVPMRLQAVATERSDVHWDDICGLEEVCSILRETLELPSVYADMFQKLPLKLRSGILLYGPPGSGKTMVAKTVSKECKLNFISVKGPELLDKYIGASERRVRELFEKAASIAPCVIFFDEFEAIAPRRGSDSTGVTDRVVNQLLCHLDGIESREGVFVLAATSRPDLVDPALLRPGRFDKSLFCGLPDREARLDLLHRFTRDLTLSPDVDLPSIADQTQGYSGADLRGMITTSAIAARKPPATPITAALLLTALAETRKSVSPSERTRYESIYAAFVGSRRPFSLDSRHTRLRTCLA